MRVTSNLAAAVAIAATTIAASPARSPDDLARRSDGLSIFGWTIAGPKRVFAPDHWAKTRKPAAAMPSTAPKSDGHAHAAAAGAASNAMPGGAAAEPQRNGRKPCS